MPPYNNVQNAGPLEVIEVVQELASDEALERLRQHRQDGN